jgi:tetratricopeptide (TPR) repeat protein
MLLITGCQKIFAGRGEAEFSEGQRAERGETHDDAMLHYNHAITADPRDERYFEARGNLYAARKDCRRALLDFTHALALTAKIGPGRIYMARARCRTELGDFAEALHDYALALMEEPNGAQYYDGMTLDALLLEKPDDALVDSDKAQSLSPDNAKFRYHHAIVLARANRRAEAVAAFGALAAAYCKDGKSIAFDGAREADRARDQPLIRWWWADNRDEEKLYEKKCAP